MPSRILVVAEGEGGAIERRAVAALVMAQRFASESRCDADLVLAGQSEAAVPGRWASVSRARTADASALADALAPQLLASGYELVLVSDTELGRELAGRLALRLAAPLIAPVVALRRQGAQTLAVRPADRGTRTASVLLGPLPSVLVVSADAGGAPLAASAAVSPAGELTVGCRPPSFQLLRETQLAPAEMDVTEAEVVVAGGRGVGGREGFAMLEELAALLGGTVGASRVAVDLGWAPYSRQVGLTGKSVSPRLYIACGISGAIHHTLGMRESSFIVAINTDRQAPIFKIANVALAGDVQQIVPALIRELRTRSNSTERRELLAGAAR